MNSTPGNLHDVRKQLGAYDTSATVAQVLVKWAIRTPGDSVCDPSFGEGVVLKSARDRLLELGSREAKNVFGVEIDGARWRVGCLRLGHDAAITSTQLLNKSFFDVEPTDFGPFTTIVGNPPFIRYQRQSQSLRRAASVIASRHGVALSGLANAWAPFLLHTLSFLQPEGRIALVLPAQLLDANYARPVLEVLQRVFTRLEVVRFENEKLFPGLSQEVVLLFGEGFGHTCESFSIRSYSNVSALAGAPPGELSRGAVFKVNGGTPGKVPFPLLLIEAQPRALFRKLALAPDVVRLGDVASVDIGYVTGASDFFHLDPSAVEELGIPSTWMRRVIRYARDVVGLRLMQHDWEKIGTRGATPYLLKQPRPSVVLPRSVDKYLRGDRAKVAKQAWQCSRRDRWWDIRLGDAPDGFLLYSPKSGSRVVENVAQVHCSNSLHRVSLALGFQRRMRDLGVGWLTSLSQLSTEIESRVLGAGLRKLDPSQAEKCLVPLVAVSRGGHRRVEKLVRERRYDAARELADEIVLVGGLGISQADLLSIRSALASIRQWQPRS